MAIRSARERWVADWVALSSRQKDGTWIFHRVTARVTRAAQAAGRSGRTDRHRDGRAGHPAVGGRAGRFGVAVGHAETTGTGKAVVRGSPTVSTVGSGAWSLRGY